MTCTHCARLIEGDRYFLHSDGAYRGKARCDPDDSGLRYGYNAHPNEVGGENVNCLCGS